MKFSELDLHPLLQKNLDKINFIECTPIQADAIPHVLQGRDIAGLAQTGTGKTAAFLVPLIDRVLRGRDKPANHIPEADSTGTANLARAAEPTVGAESSAGAESAAGEESSAGAQAAKPEKIAPGEVIEASPEELPAPSQEPSLRYFKDWRRRQYILILVPTRELAEQVYENARKFLEGTGLKAISVMGGTTYDKQKAGFKDGCEFVIATPGRLLDLYKENVADLRQVRAVVFDEADRMFDMGFKDDMKFILRRLPQDRQFLVFSATLNFEVLNTAYEFGAYPVEINVSKDQPKAENVSDELLHVGQDEKAKFLLSVLKKKQPRQAIIFSNFKHNVERIARFLSDNGIPAVGISSLLTQAQRNRVMAQFKAENDQNILVATDLAARGLDILGVDMVVNFELPDDPENYVHRIGRTGRAGAKGEALSLVSDRDVDALTRIEDYLGHKIEIGWMDDADLVKEMKAFPQDRSRPRPSGGFGGGRGGGRDGQRRGEGGLRRASGGRPPPRGARRDGSRDSQHESRRDGGPRDARRDSRRDGGPRDARHDSRRDGGPRDARHDSRRDGGPRDARHDSRRDGGPRDSRHDSRYEGGGRQHEGRRDERRDGQYAGSKEGRRDGGSREGRRDRSPDGNRQSRASGQSSNRRFQGRGSSGRRASTNGAPRTTQSKGVSKSASAAPGIGKKVSSFFKKLIGK